MTSCRTCNAPQEPRAEQCPHCGTLWPLDSYIGQVVHGEFQLRDVLGRGSMGTVYRAFHQRTEQWAAVKILNDSADDNPHIARYLKREARLLSTLRHPHLVSFVAFGEHTNGALYIITEYIRGRSLSHLIQNHAPLPIERAILITTQILLALETIHAQNIIHRDLKPDNILLDEHYAPHDHIRLLDFGVAKVLTQDPSTLSVHQSIPGQTLGTPAYMSPEQAHGQELDPRSDLYAIGILLYQLLTRTLPHHANSPMALLVKRLSEDPKPPSQRLPEHLQNSIPPELDNLCLQLLARDPSDRPPGARTLRIALHNILQSYAARATSPALETRSGSYLPPQATSSSSALASSSHISPSFSRLSSASRLNLSSEHISVPSTRTHNTHHLTVRIHTQPSHLTTIQSFLHSLQLPEHLQRTTPTPHPYAHIFKTPHSNLQTLASFAIHTRDTLTQHFPNARFTLLITPHNPNSFPNTTTHNNHILISKELLHLLHIQHSTIPSPDPTHNLLLEHTNNPLALSSPVTLHKLASHASGLHHHKTLCTTLRNDLLQCTQNARGKALALVAPIGHGKSILLSWLRHFVYLSGIPCLSVSCHNRLHPLPFQPLISLIFQLIGLPDHSTPHTDVPSHTHDLLLQAEIPTHTADAFRNLLSIHFNPSNTHASCKSTQARLEQIPHHETRILVVNILGQLLKRATELGPITITIDDVHQANTSTSLIIPSLAIFAQSLPILLVATSHAHPLPSLERFQVHRIPQLSQQQILALAAPTHHTPPPDGPLEPLYAYLWKLSDHIQPPPPSLQHLIVHLFQRLDPNIQRVLSIACVLGEYFYTYDLERVINTVQALDTVLAQLKLRGFLTPDPSNSKLWTFRNPTIRNTLYKSIPSQQRIELHTKIYRNLSKIRSQTPHDALVRTIHADRALLGSHAFQHAHVLADRFALSGDLHTAESWYYQALAALQRSQTRTNANEEPIPTNTINEFLLNAADITLRLGHIKRAQRLLKHLKANTNDQTLFKTLLTARLFLCRGDLARAGQALSQHPHPSPIPPQNYLLHLLRGHILIIGSHYEAALQVIERPIQHLRTLNLTDDLDHLLPKLLSLQATAVFHLGRHEQSFSILLEAIQHTVQTHNPDLIIPLLNTLARHWIVHEQPNQLIHLCKSLLSKPSIPWRPSHILILERWIARAHQSLGDDETAQPLFENALRRAEALGWSDFANQTRSDLAWM